MGETERAAGCRTFRLRKSIGAVAAAAIAGVRRVLRRVAARVGGRGRFNDLAADAHHPLMLQQLHGAGAVPGVAHKAARQEIDALGTELVGAGELRRVALRDVVHDGPLVVEVGPRPATRHHLKNDAAE